MTDIVFIDTETTGVHPERLPWEIAMIKRTGDGPDQELSFFVDVDLSAADPFGLKIGKFWERHPMGRYLSGLEVAGALKTVQPMVQPWQAAEKVMRWTHDALLVGAVPNFDAETLAPIMRKHNLMPTWRYHLIDVETLAAGALKLPPPWNFDKVLEAYGLTYAEEDRHTALGDARMARDLYDAVYGREVRA